MNRTSALLLAILVGAPCVARAGDESTTEEPTRSFDSAIKNAEAGTFNPFTFPARVEGRGSIAILSGYDSAYKSFELTGNAEVRVYGPLAVRVGVQWVPQKSTIYPTAGLRLQVLKQGTHGIDLAVSAYYKAEGLTQGSTEGEIEANVAIGRSFGRLHLLGNLVGGSDFDGNDHDGEVRLSGVYSVRDTVLIGVDSRTRFDLGSNTANLVANNKATFDVVAGPTLTVLVGPVALMATAGYSGAKLYNAASYANGAIAMAGAGGAF